MDVTKSNFSSARGHLASLLPRASFVALDLEMGGIDAALALARRPVNSAVVRAKNALSDEPQTRYERIRAAATTYPVLQVGVSVFCPSETDAAATTTASTAEGRGEGAEEEVPRSAVAESPPAARSLLDADAPPPLAYTASTFTFHVNPLRPKIRDDDGRINARDPVAHETVTLDASAAAFLLRNGFDFQKWLSEGVCLSNDARVEEARGKIWPSEEERRRREEAGKWRRRPVALEKEEDRAVVDDAMKKVREWAENGGGGGKEEEEEEEETKPPTPLLLGSEGELNGFLRRALYERVEASHPDVAIESVPVLDDNGDPVPWKKALKLERLTASEREARSAEEAAKREDEARSLFDQVRGFHSAWTVLREAAVPTVVHNGGLDAAYLVQSLGEDLPERYDDYRALVRRHFPGGLFDTRHMAMEGVADAAGAGGRGHGLGALFGEVDRVRRERATEAAAEKRDGDGGETAAGTEAKQDEAEAKPHDAADEEGPPAFESRCVEVTPGGPSEEFSDVKEQAHEAGYDAYMTGVVFAAFARALWDHHGRSPGGGNGGGPTAASSGARPLVGFRNRLPLHACRYYMDMGDDDGTGGGRGWGLAVRGDVWKLTTNPSLDNNDDIRALLGGAAGRRGEGGDGGGGDGREDGDEGETKEDDDWRIVWQDDKTAYVVAREERRDAIAALVEAKRGEHDIEFVPVAGAGEDDKPAAPAAKRRRVEE